MTGAGDDARLVEEEGAEAGGGRAQRRVDDGRRDGDAVAGVRDAALRYRYRRQSDSDLIDFDPKHLYDLRTLNIHGE